MRQWSGLVYLVAGVIIGLLVGASLTGMAAAGDEPASGDNHPGRYTFTVSGDDTYSVLDTQTGTLYRFRRITHEQGYWGRVINPLEGWYGDFTFKKRVAPQPPSE